MDLHRKAYHLNHWLFSLHAFKYLHYSVTLSSRGWNCFFGVCSDLNLISERCKLTTKGVHPPSFQGQLISFHLGLLDLSLQQETKKKGQHDCNEMEKIPL